MSTQSVNSIFNWLVAGAAMLALVWLLSQKSTVNIDPPQDDWFQTQVVQQSGPVLVKFGAEWCGPCKATDKALEEYARAHTAPISIVKIDVDEKRELAAHYRVSSIPRMFLMHHGKILDHQTGGMDADSISRWIDSNAAAIK
jgi:thioredoxin